jgi:hypothetical protein
MKDVVCEPIDSDSRSAHTLHIPVMGTGYTIDTPLRVAKFGISSVISLVDDVLIEQMRKFHCEKAGEPYEEITDRDEDPRAHRITAYLNLLDKLVRAQVKQLRNSPFEKGSEITRYYEMLPETPLKRCYRAMLAEKDAARKKAMQKELRAQAVPGGIDVNIMTKLNAAVYRNGEPLPLEFNDAMSALRGYALSNLHSSIEFSAGLNQHLYSYAAKFKDFLPDEKGHIAKKIVLKVSDYRSGVVQGKFLAKRCLWVSEYRIESGLNCGGHAFATQGYLLGPILEEFKQKKQELSEMLHAVYNEARVAHGMPAIVEPHKMRITVQGGIGTADENDFLLKYYEVDGTGWGTPFLLAPDVTNVDDKHLARLAAATEEDVYLSDSSPMGVPFWNLRTSASEEARRDRVEKHTPGSPCPKGYIATNTEFTRQPICTGSRAYQQKKLQELQNDHVPPHLLETLLKSVLAKSCICHDLGGGATIKNGIDPEATPAICCGPNIAYFSKITFLEEMMDHIYGRGALLMDSARQHMFIQELKIYIEHLRKEVEKMSGGLSERTPKYFSEFKENLLSGIAYYHQLASHLAGEKRKRFLAELQALRDQIERIRIESAPKMSSAPA